MIAKEINAKGLTVHGCWHWNHQRDTRAMMGTIRGAKSFLDKLITHTFPFSKVQEAMETRAGNQCGKIILPRGRVEQISALMPENTAAIRLDCLDLQQEIRSGGSTFGVLSYDRPIDRGNG